MRSSLTASARLCRLAFLLAAVIPAQQESTRVEFDAVAPELIQQRLEMVSEKIASRKSVLEELFREAGCEGDSLAEQPVRRAKQPNIICVSPGTGDGDIVVGGHFDLVSLGMGAVDDWSGAVLLPSLYQSLKSRPHRHRFVFVAFSGEEVGLLGSQEYVHRLSREQKKSVRAMINLECLGLGRPNVWASRADKRLLGYYTRVASSLKLPVSVVNVEKVGDDDSHSFLREGIPVLTIHSITQYTFGILHTKNDNLRAIDAQEYYTAYRLAATYLAFLDGVLE